MISPIGPQSAKIMIVGSHPTVNDVRAGHPFAGVSGTELTRMLHEVGIIRTECYITHVSLERLGGDESYAFAKNKTEAKKAGVEEFYGKYPKPAMVKALGSFNDTVEKIQPNVIIALGELALWATTGNSGITKWRGSVLEGFTGVKVVPTYSPEKILKKWDWRWIAVQDLRRALRESEYPEVRVPPYSFIIRPNLETVIQWLQDRLIKVGVNYEAIQKSSTDRPLPNDGNGDAPRNNLQTEGDNNSLGADPYGAGTSDKNRGGSRLTEPSSNDGSPSPKRTNRPPHPTTGAGDRSETGCEGNRVVPSESDREIRERSRLGGMGSEEVRILGALNEVLPGTTNRPNEEVRVPREITPLLIAVDIETRAGHIECLSLADSIHDAICIPLMTRDSNEGYWAFEEELLIIKLLRELLTHEHVHVVGQNFLYDAQYFAKHWGYIPNVQHDTMYEHHVAFAGLPKGLDFLSSLYCNHHRFWKEDAKGYNPNLTDEDRWIYNCRDSVITLECHHAIQMTLSAFGLEEQARMQMRLFRPLLRMMLRGTRFDMKKRDKMGPALMEAIGQTELFLHTVAGDLPAKPKSKTASPWYNSPTQLAKFLYETLGLPVQRHRKTGRPTTDDNAIEKLGKKEPLLRQFFEAIAALRSLGVFYNTFVKAPLDPDNRIRCSFNPAGTETYRLASSKDAFGFGTNLQNIPKGNKL